MNSKRSVWKVLLGVVGMSLLVTNCTIKTDSDKTDDDDTGCAPVGKKKNCTACPDGVTGYQTCQDDGTYDACYCPGSNIGGGSSGGASSAGASSSTAGKGGATATEGGASNAGEGGEGGDATVGPAVDPNDCYDCLNKLCTLEWDACVAEDEDHPQDPVNAPNDYCLSKGGDGSGQIEAIIDCIDKERMNGLAKRAAVRACGSSLGQSSDPSFFEWPPQLMTAATEGLMNCMADAPDEVDQPGRWADSTNIPPNGSPKPWLSMTCAKLSCTSAF